MSERETPLPLGYTPPAPKAPRPVSNIEPAPRACVEDAPIRCLLGHALQVDDVVILPRLNARRDGLALGTIVKLNKVTAEVTYQVAPGVTLHQVRLRGPSMALHRRPA